MIDRSPELEELERGLAAVQRWVHRGSLLSALARGVTQAAGVAVACGAVACAVILIVRFNGFAAAGVVTATLRLATAGIVAACLARPIVIAARKKPTLANAAERLDLGRADHNRVANAYYLASEGPDSPFARAAIADGLATLRQASPDVAIADNPQWRLTRPLIQFAIAAGLFLLPAFISPLPAHENSSRSSVATIAGASSRQKPTNRDEATRPPTTTFSAPNRESSAGRAASAAGGAASQSRSAAVLSPSAASGASAAAGTSSTKAESADPSQGMPAASGEPSKPDAQAAAKTTASESGSGGDTRGAAAGSSAENGGRGSAGTALSAGAEQKPEAPRGMTGPNGAAGEQAALADSNQQQNSYNAASSPLRQDRGGSVSRELGQSGNSGESGNGRGGPSEVKKARGAGAVFLSVPLPDFLAGKLSPGTSRTTRQQIPSQSMMIPSPLPVPVTPSAGGTEAIIDRFDVPLDRAADVARYLSALHRSDEAAAPETSAAPAAAPSVPTVQGALSP